MQLRTKTLLLIIWIAITIPMCLFGYGSDLDAWMLAEAAGRIWDEFAYHPSRTTGFPLMELLNAPIIATKQWYLSNLLTLIFGIAALFALFRLSDRGWVHRPIHLVLVVGFLPVFVTNASSTMDYVPGLALQLWSLAFLLEGRNSKAAVLIGLACGFRPSNLLLVLPALFLLWRRGGRFNRLLMFGATALLVGLVCFSPALLAFGGLSSPQRIIEPDLRILMAGYHFLGLLGVLQSLIVYPYLAFRLHRIHGLQSDGSSTRHLREYHLALCAVWIPLFVLLPFEPEYLFPIIPAIGFLVDGLSTRRAALVLTVLLLSQHLFGIETAGGESGQRVFRPALRAGWTIRDLRHRVFILSTREAADRWNPSGKTVLMFGANWIPQHNLNWSLDTSTGFWKRRDGLVYLTNPILDEDRLRSLGESRFPSRGLERATAGMGPPWRSGLEGSRRSGH